MYTECADRTPPRRAKFAPALESVALIVAVACALAAFAVYLMPNEALEWAIAHFG
jgi:hypothetical protein